MDSLEEIEGHIDILTLEEAWLQAYPDPREFLQFFLKKLKFYDDRDRQMIQHFMRFQAECSRVEGLEENEKILQKNLLGAQLDVIKSRELLAKERDKYNAQSRKLQDLQLDNEDYRRKYHAVCFLTGTTDKDVAHFFQRNPSAANVTDKMSEIRQEIGLTTSMKSNKYSLANPVILGKKIDQLEIQLNTIEDFYETKCRSAENRYQLELEQMTMRLENLHFVTDSTAHRNQELKELLTITLREHLDLQKAIKQNEKAWGAERERLIKMVAAAHNQRINSSISTSNLLETTMDNTSLVRSLKTKLSRTEVQLLEKSNFVEKCKSQIFWLTKDVELHANRILLQRKKNISDRKKFDEKIQMLEKRITEDDKRRKLEGSGFREDVKNLKKSLTKLERSIKSISCNSFTKNEELPPRAVAEKRSASAPNPKIDQLHHKRCIRRVRTAEDEQMFELIAHTYQTARDQVLKLAEAVRDSSL